MLFATLEKSGTSLVLTNGPRLFRCLWPESNSTFPIVRFPFLSIPRPSNHWPKEQHKVSYDHNIQKGCPWPWAKDESNHPASQRHAGAGAQGENPENL